MHNQSDFGYSTCSACIACGSQTLNCCAGDGVRFTHKIIGEDGFVAGFYNANDVKSEMHYLRIDRATAHNYYEVREVIL
jgi:hypothetical protein